LAILTGHQVATTVTMAPLAPAPAGTLSVHARHHRHATGNPVPGGFPAPRLPLAPLARVEGVLALHRAFGAHRGRHCGGVEGA